MVSPSFFPHYRVRPNIDFLDQWLADGGSGGYITCDGGGAARVTVEAVTSMVVIFSWQDNGNKGDGGKRMQDQFIGKGIVISV